MGIFNRLFGPDKAGIPEWAQFFESVGAFRAFERTVATDLRARGLEFQIVDGIARLSIEGRAHGNYGLQNVAQICASTDGGNWPTVVREHFDNILIRSSAEQEELKKRKQSLEGIQDSLRVRLYSRETVEQSKATLIRRDIADDLLEVLVYDLPSAVLNVSVDDAARWGRPDLDLLEIGRANVSAEPRLERSLLNIPQGGSLEMLSGPSFFAASHALHLARYVQDVSPKGFLVAVPSRHLVVFHSIRDLNVVHAVKGLIMVAHGQFERGPGSISQSIYWVQGTSFMRLPAQAGEKGIVFSPPSEFLAMLIKLGSQKLPN
jgi:hypothetical protein